MMPTVIPKGHTFLEMDKLFTLKTGILTLIGVILVMISGLLPVLSLPFDGSLGIEIIPYRPTLVLMFVLLFSAATGNLASALIIGLFGGISIVSPEGPNVAVHFPQGYFLLMIFSALIAAYLGNAAFTGKTINLIISIFFLVDLVVVILLSLGFNNHIGRYTSNGIPVGHGGSLFGTTFPVIEIITVLLGLIFSGVVIYFFGVRKGTLTKSDAEKMNIVGLVLIALGGIFGIISSIIFVTSFDQAIMNSISPEKNNLVIRDHYFHVINKYGVTVAPWNEFVALIVVFGLIMLGAIFRIISLGRGNIRKVKIGTIASYVTIPVAFIVYTLMYLPEIATLFGYANSFNINYSLSAVYVSAWIGFSGVTSIFMLIFEALIAWILKTIEK